MSMHVPIAKNRKPARSKTSALTENSKDVPVEIGKAAIPSNMGRTRSGIHNSPLVWGNRVYDSKDRKHPNAKPC
jgi:hypothetical protein